MEFLKMKICRDQWLDTAVRRVNKMEGFTKYSEDRGSIGNSNDKTSQKNI